MAVSKKTPAKVAIILAMLRTGCTHRAAYGLARISRDTFYDWMRTDETFSAKVREAEAVAEAEWLSRAVAEGKNYTKLLSMRFRDDWGEQIRVEHTGAVEVTYTNSWRTGAAADAPSWSDPSSTDGTEVQLASGGETVAEDDPVPVDSG